MPDLNPVLPPTSSRRARVFQLTTSIIFALGAFFHACRMIAGNEYFVAVIFPPIVDIAFGLLMLVAAVAGVPLIKKRPVKILDQIVYFFSLLLLVVSIPIHLNTVLTWSTAYTSAFPMWYSAAEIPVFVVLALLVLRLSFRR